MRKFQIVDVFGLAPFKGNPVAVVLDAEGLSDERMQQIARWTNLSETTFCLPARSPDADYRLRIFTPESELPFAGHPTLGSAHALIAAGYVRPRADTNGGRVTQECAAGLVPIQCDKGGGNLSLTMPPARIETLDSEQARQLALIMGDSELFTASPAIVDVGPHWVVAAVNDCETLRRLTPDFAAEAAFDRKLGTTGVSLYARSGDGAGDIEVRSFAPASGISEDPVCGSGNGAVAAFRLARGEIADGAGYSASQGRCVKRDGAVRVTITGTDISIGGNTTTLVEGVITGD